MADLPSEIIEEILLKLPVKSLVRFRCVSKQWHSLITHSRFVRKHVNHNLTNSHHNSLVLSSNQDMKIVEQVWVTQKEEKQITLSHTDLPDILFPTSPKRIYAVSPSRFYYFLNGCCDGILCLIQADHTLLLWNPRIGDYKRLALPASFAGRTEVIGFGYDSSIDDYKVVRAPTLCWRKNNSVVEVLTLKSNSWRRLYDDFPFRMLYNACTQQFICANGGIYWLAGDATRPLLPRTTLLCFGLKEEKFNEVPLPAGVVAETNVTLMLGNLGGCLCMLDNNTQLDTNLDLWMMKEGTNWLKLVSIPKFSGLDSESWFTPLCLTKEGAVLMNLVDLRLSKSGSTKFVTYQPKDSTFKQITVDDLKSWYQVVVYSESLVSPCASNGIESQYLAR